MQDLTTQIIITLLGVIFGMAGFWIMIGRKFVTREETELMIRDSNAVVHNEIKFLNESRILLGQALDKNTDAVTELRIALAKIMQLVETLSERNRNDAS